MESRIGNIENILAYAGTQYVVPSYQRAYSWQEEEWEMLWFDVLENASLDLDKEHFFGVWIAMPIESTSGEPRSYLIIDGQQRLITISILLAALRDVVKVTDQRLANLIEQYLFIDSVITLDRQPVIQTTPQDKNAYHEVIIGEIQSNSTIAAVYRYFLDKVQEYLQNGGDLTVLLRSTTRGLVLV